MRVRRLFIEHPASVGETYTQHLCAASGFAGRMLMGGTACFVHALLPFLFIQTGSACISDLYERMVRKRNAQVREHATMAASAPLFSGVLLATALAILAELASTGCRLWLNPAGPSPVSAVLCAVLLGVAWRNTLGLSERHASGLHWTSDKLLRVGIALVGLRLSLGSIASTAATALPVVAVCIATALAVSYLAGRVLGISRPLALLLAAGTAVCGCTAIVAVTPVVRARPVETGLALTCVVVIGCAGMLIYPWLAHRVFGSVGAASGVFLGTSIHDTSQVVGASLIYAQQFGAPNVVAVAGFVKLLRNLSLLLLVPLFAMWSGRGDAQPAGRLNRSQLVPMFLIAFVLFAVVRAAGDHFFAASPHGGLWSLAIESALKASDLLLICGMAALGLNVSLAQLRGIGARALLAALVVAAAVCLSSLSVITLMKRLL